MSPSHLIVVCCHGIWLGGSSKGLDDDEWLIADFQRGETPTFTQHVKAGVELLAEHGQDAVLAFSGGPTRRETQISEAQSYANIAQANLYWNHTVPQDSILLEERALDSYHNVLFSLTLFFSRFGVWPSQVSIVSHAFKRLRLVDSHCVAIGWPLERVVFVGIDPPGLAGKDDAMAGAAKAVGEWNDDPHGRGTSLKGKRGKRNPWNVWQGAFTRETTEEEKAASRLVLTGERGDETLVDDAVRPWM